ncbi:hypothetical protein EI42_04663 [Thermosporothrix hazakensis]|jgi:hypothetical protein|uniref:WD40 repeat protein n=1 Tax=Thermosporothrix hazakensis TaxID=644383 RepID=A0A326U233_THEHA|nr:hypothetical protein [Thermosporothrix hazakensis]PZW24216.1 hypothetical protein EI42_04663 [Thermosporothrix hazakensis]
MSEEEKQRNDLEPVDDDLMIVDLDPPPPQTKGKQRVGDLHSPLMHALAWVRKPQTRVPLLSVTLIVGTVLVLLLSGTLPDLAAILPGKAPEAPSPSPQSWQDEISCVYDAAWSADSRLLAVIGVYGGCETSEVSYAYLNVYDVVQQKRLQQYTPEELIIQQYREQFSAGFHGTIGNYLVRWSPELHQLACLFLIWPPIGSGEKLLEGVLLLHEDGSSSAFFHPLPLAAKKRWGSWGYGVWDLKQKRYLEKPRKIQEKQAFGFTFPPAPAYRWLPDGSLQPLMQNAIGLDRSAAFSFWQEGSVARIEDKQKKAVFLVWMATPVVWSPDGRYLTRGLILGGRIEVPGITSNDQEALRRNGLDAIEVVQPPDRALMQALREAEALERKQEMQYIVLLRQVAWSPDRQMMAALNTFSRKVTVFRSKTGESVAKMDFQAGIDDESSLLHWSPDGRFLVSAAQKLLFWNVQSR